MKERSAARKRAETAVLAQLPGLGSNSTSGSNRAFHVDSIADCSQLVRHLVDRQAPPPPTWRRQRPALMIEAAEVTPDPPEAATLHPEPNCVKAAGEAASGETVTLTLTGWVRAAGLSANQLLSIPGAGDFQIDVIQGPAEPQALGGVRARKAGRGAAHDADMGGVEVPVLAQADPEEREGLERENVGADGQVRGGLGWWRWVWGVPEHLRYAACSVLPPPAPDWVQNPYSCTHLGTHSHTHTRAPVLPVPAQEGDGEQTWPTEAELDEAEAAAQRMFQRRRVRKKVPEGVCARAHWAHMGGAEGARGGRGLWGLGAGAVECGGTDELGTRCGTVRGPHDTHTSMHACLP